MGQFSGFGTGADGALVISSNTTESPVDSSCSGSAGANTLTVGAGLTFAAGDMVLIHQTRGTGAGAWEIQKVNSYSGTTLTLFSSLDNTYTDSGASQAQVRKVPQYSSVTVNSGVTWKPKAWDGNVGGILALMCSGTTTVTGTISAAGTQGTYVGPADHPGDDTSRQTRMGFGGGEVEEEAQAYQGEGTGGDRTTQSSSANGNGGGGANGSAGNRGGGGGGNGSAGSNGGNSGGTGGSTAGAADLTTMVFGGAGGGGAAIGGTEQSTGGTGGGIIVIISRNLIVTGSITANGGSGSATTTEGPGGGGAGGSILVKAFSATLGSSLVTATGGTGEAGNAGTAGGNGGDGRIRVEACTVSGTTNPTVSSATTRTWCSSAAYLL